MERCSLFVFDSRWNQFFVHITTGLRKLEDVFVSSEFFYEKINGFEIFECLTISKTSNPIKSPCLCLHKLILKKLMFKTEVLSKIQLFRVINSLILKNHQTLASFFTSKHPKVTFLFSLLTSQSFSSFYSNQITKIFQEYLFTPNLLSGIRLLLKF